MKIKVITLVLFSLILFSCQNSKQSVHYAFFEIIIGEWQLEDMPVVEKWTYVDGQFQASVIVTSGGDQMVTEEIQIIENGDGIFYEADVEDQNNGEPVLFKMIYSVENKLIFENKEHDFPQRITYELIDKNNLIATIEGILEGESKLIDFNYSKVND